MIKKKEKVGFLDFVSLEKYTYGVIYRIQEYLEQDSVQQCIEMIHEKMDDVINDMKVLYVSHKKSSGCKVLHGKNKQRIIISYINLDNFLKQTRQDLDIFYNCIIFDSCYSDHKVKKISGNTVYVSINNNRVIDELAHVSNTNKENIVLLEDMTLNVLYAKFNEKDLHIRLDKDGQDIGYVSNSNIIVVNDIGNLLNLELPKNMYNRVIMYDSMFPDPRDSDKKKEIEIMSNLPLLKNSQVIACIHPSKIEIVSFLKPKMYIFTGVNLVEINKM